MLIDCAECGLKVSDKAVFCPHCGLPFTTTKSISRNKKRMRLPNGFGQITELKQPNLRNPFRVMVTVGKTDEGKPISKLLKPQAYFKTYNEAYAALVEYNKSPYDLDTDLILKELYVKWFEEYSTKHSSASYDRAISSAWNHCKPLYNMRVKDIRSYHIKNIMDSIESPNMKARTKSVFNLMLDYALEHEIVSINHARAFNIDKNIIKDVEEKKVKHQTFTDEEMSKLWKNSEDYWTSVVLFQCYTGLRPQELGLIELSNVYDTNIIGGMKTDAGRNRFIPLCTKIRPIAKKLKDLSVSRNSKYLIPSEDGTRLTYDKYKGRYKNVISLCGLDTTHRPHDPRKHFVTICKKYNVDEYALKRVVGHSISDITEKVYTDRTTDWLIEEIEKIQE